MKSTNGAGWDRIARIALGIVLLFLGWSGTVTHRSMPLSSVFTRASGFA